MQSSGVAQDKTVLVTGAAIRIGRAVALDMAAKGWRVVVHCNNSGAQARELAEHICSTGGQALAIEADLSEPDAAGEIFKACSSWHGTITCLINNASVFENDDLTSLTAMGWDEHLNVNLRAPVLLAQAFAAQCPAESDGVIINMIDQRAWRLTPHFFSYTISKSALWTATQTMAQALAPHIRVNGIGLGPTMANKRQSAEDFERQAKAVPLGHGPSADEICEAVQFILSSRSLTGQMIALDGGQHLAWQTPDVVATREWSFLAACVSYFSGSKLLP